MGVDSSELVRGHKAVPSGESSSPHVDITLQLGSWKYDPNQPLGPRGGFGEVFAGWDSHGFPVAVKRLHFDAERAGHRELRIAEDLAGHRYRHVIPILDAGLDPESGRYFIVMAKAEESLQQYLERKGGLAEGSAVAILDDIAAGLEEIANLVHRDLKPGNVLLHDGSWKISDLGIARFVEEATSTNTLRDCLSPQYAAPEQWLLQKVTKAADIYALGCVAYALVAAHPPFGGPEPHDYREQHLKQTHDDVLASPRYRQIVSMCLMKPPQARPDISSVRAMLAQAMRSQSTQSQSILAEAGALHAKRLGEAGAEKARLEHQEAIRRDIAGRGLKALLRLWDDLLSEIGAELHMAETFESEDGTKLVKGIRLGDSELSCRFSYPFIEHAMFAESGWNVAAGVTVSVTQQKATYPGRSANLWYADLRRAESFRWWEVCYMTHPLVSDRRRVEPFGFENEIELGEANLAAAPVVARYQLASMPTAIDMNGYDDFASRWKERLALAAMGKLGPPTSLPE